MFDAFTWTPLDVEDRLKGALRLVETKAQPAVKAGLGLAERRPSLSKACRDESTRTGRPEEPRLLSRGRRGIGGVAGHRSCEVAESHIRRRKSRSIADAEANGSNAAVLAEDTAQVEWMQEERGAATAPALVPADSVPPAPSTSSPVDQARDRTTTDTLAPPAADQPTIAPATTGTAPAERAAPAPEAE